MSSSFSSEDSSGEEGENQFTPTKAIFPNLSPDEEKRVLKARLMELKRSKAMAQSSTSSDAYKQNGNETNDEGCSSSLYDGGQQHALAGQFQAILERMNMLLTQQRQNEAETKAFAGQFNAVLERMNVLEKKQRQNEAVTNASIGKFSQLHNEQKAPPLEEIGELEAKDTEEQQKKLSSLPPNCWKANCCHSDLEILGNDCLMAHYNESGNGASSVFAKYSITSNEIGIFYYEMKVEKVKNSVSIGLGTKAMPLYRSVGQHLDSYAYESNGTFLANGTSKKGKEKYTNGDVVGFGVHLGTRRIIFTKNGICLETSNLFISPSSFSSDLLLFPCVTLCDCGDKIAANFGPNFLFDPANAKAFPQFCFKSNFWDDSACPDGLAISGSNNTMVYRKKNVNGYYCAVFAKYSLLSSAVHPLNIFYFELNVKNFKRWVFFGFAVKHQTPLDEYIANRTGSYTYENNGYFYINGSRTYGNESFGEGDTVGCGVNLTNQQVFFTKNGRRIDATNNFVISSSPSADLLFPFVSLRLPNDKIVANFGPEFLFDVSTLC